jgi:hypothetical protein
MLSFMPRWRSDAAANKKSLAALRTDPQSWADRNVEVNFPYFEIMSRR